MALLLKSAIPVWVVSALCAVGIGVLLAPSEWLRFLPVAMAFAVILTLLIQVAIARTDGYIVRMSATVAGSLLILGIATAVLAPVALARS